MEFKLLIVSGILLILEIVMRKLRSKIKGETSLKVFNYIYDWIATGWSAVLLAAILMYFVIQAFKIPSGSMRMTLLEGDHLFVNKFIYGFHIPLNDGKRIYPLRKVQRGDIIIFSAPQAALNDIEREQRIQKDFVKRCIALPGDTIEIRNKIVYINGKQINEPYINFEDNFSFPYVNVFTSSEQYQYSWETGKFATLPSDLIRDNFGPITVPINSYFAMGDNRDRSFDSRFWGPVPDKNLKGRALFLYWPISRVRLIK